MRNVHRVDTIIVRQAKKIPDIVNNGVHHIADGIELHEAVNQSAKRGAAQRYACPQREAEEAR